MTILYHTQYKNFYTCLHDFHDFGVSSLQNSAGEDFLIKQAAVP